MQQNEYIEGLPSSLIACFLGETQMHAAGISPRSVVFRTTSPIPSEKKPLRFCFYRPERGTYDAITINNYETGKAQRENDAVLSRFFFDDPACAAAIRRAMNDFARYAETRSSFGASAYGHDTTGYPLDKEDSFPSSLQEAQENWYAALPPVPFPDEGCSFSISLHSAKLWNGYMHHPLPDFMDVYASLVHVPRSLLPLRGPDRIYIGNPYCSRIFPEPQLLEAVADKAVREGLGVTLVTSLMRFGEEGSADALLDFAARRGFEVEINDWGMLARAQNRPLRPSLLLGTLLNRRRKDPRMPWKAGYARNENLFSRNALNDPGWQDYLHSLGIRRFEFESTPQHPQIPDFPSSLHLPFYQTNTSAWCPLQAICENGERGAQSGSADCLHECEENVLLYPDHLKMLGRWNSLLALSTGIDEIPAGIDRLVLNF